MKRFAYPIVWSIFASVVLSGAFLFETRSRAQSLTDLPLVSLQASSSDVWTGRKVSDDILKKVAEGKGAEFVRVVIQYGNQSELLLDSAIETTGAVDIRKLKNFKVRIATLPVNAAVALAARSDVSYVSLNRAVQPMGHVSLTSGADQVRSNTDTSSTKRACRSGSAKPAPKRSARSNNSATSCSE